MLESREKVMTTKSGKLPKRAIYAYGLGDFASNLTNTLMSSYLSIFYTDIVGIAPVIVSIMFLVAKIWDGINDPMFGAIAERTNTKKGRFRPYIFYFTPFLAISAVLVFTKVGIGGTSSVIWAAVTYILWGMLYTVVNVSYGSLSTVMTTDPDDIAQLNSFRMIGTYVASVGLSMITPMILTKVSGGTTYTAKGYQLVAIIYAVCSIPLFYLLYANCKETIKPKKSSTNVSIATSLKSVLSNRPLLLVFATMFLCMLAFFGRLGIVIYYIIYYLGRPDLISVCMALPSVMSIIGILVTKNLVVKLGKKKFCAIGFIGSGLSLIIMYFVPASNTTAIIILHALYGFFGFNAPIPMSMIPEAIDYQEDKTGIRSDGISYAAVSLSTKIGGAIGPSLALLVMSGFGYVANAQQSARALQGINVSANLVFGIFYLLSLIPLALYPLNAEKNAEIRARLDEKK